MIKTDEELMIAYQQGSLNDFEQLYFRHKNKVMGFITKKLKISDQEKEEVFQSIFSKLHQNKHLYDAKRPFLPWFFTLINHAIIDHHRREKVDYVELPHDPSDEGQVAQGNNHEIQEEIHKVFSNINEEEAQLLYKKFVDGLSYKELEAQFNVKSSTLRKRVSRLISKIKV